MLYSFIVHALVVSRNGEGVAFVPWSTLDAVFLMLLGLGAAWAGLYVAHANSVAASHIDEFNPDATNPGAPPARRWSPAEAWLWRFAWMVGGLGFICLGVTALHYTKGQYIEVPGNVPLIDRVLWVSSFVCIAVSFAALFAGAMIVSAHERRTRREKAGD